MAWSSDGGAGRHAWPELHLAEWKETCDTLHLWSQVVGKIRLGLAPQTNHWWSSALLVTSRGLTTTPIPYRDGAFELRFDFLDHSLALETADGDRRGLSLVPRSVADFYREVLRLLDSVGIQLHLWPVPVEVEGPVPFEEDSKHAAYDPEQAYRFFRALSGVDLALKEFATRFQGKQSPVHFFWGGFDLASTRFSGRPAPARPNADLINREAYFQEVMSFGFWPGKEGICDTTLYAYAAPEPQGFNHASLPLEGAYYDSRLGEFLFPYELARASGEPSRAIIDFCEHVYEAGASLGEWDREALDRAGIRPAIGVEVKPIENPVESASFDPS